MKKMGKKIEGLADTKLSSLIVTLCFIFFAIVILLIANVLSSTEELRLENAIERAFNNVILSIQTKVAPSEEAMREKGILGFGYYTYTGTALYTWGDAYFRLPITTFSDISSDSVTVTSYDEETGKMECVRYSRGIEIRPDNLFDRNADFLVFPDVIYLAFQASSYMEKRNVVRIFSVAALVALFFVYIIVLYTVRENNRYRVLLREQEKLVSLGHASRTLAHEIKNPLSAIAITLGILRKEVPEELKDDIAVIEHETKRIKNLSDRVSDYLKNPRGKPVKVDLVKTVEEMMVLFPGGIRMLSSADTAYVFFDPERLRSVLENVIKNAVEAQERSEVLIQIDKGPRHFWQLSVNDEGPGISEEAMEKMFEPFFTTKDKGSGIGLAICKDFLEAAGGSISLKNKPWGGAVALLLIPRYGRRKEKKN